MIPKIIHYCWLSGEPFPEVIAECIQTWKEQMPDYEFVLWDTDRFDVHASLYVRQAYERKKYAFASDYIRLYALYYYGGIYLDCDVRVFKRFDALLNAKAFTGFEHEGAVAAWLLASEKGNPLFAAFLAYYEHKKFLLADGSLDLTPNVKPLTNILMEHGLQLNGEYQELAQITVYPRTWFCPVLPYAPQYKDCYSENTYAQHMFYGAWMEDAQKKLVGEKRRIAQKYGEKASLLYYGIMTLRKDGVCSFLNKWKVRAESRRIRRKYEKNRDRRTFCSGTDQWDSQICGGDREAIGCPFPQRKYCSDCPKTGGECSGTDQYRSGKGKKDL